MLAIIGRGNVASHLFTAFKDKMEIRLVNPHTLEDLPENPDVILLSVSDNAISEVIEKLPDKGCIVAHTSGSIPMDVFKDKYKKYGVFYPLQTFTKETELNYREIPVFIEGNEDEARADLKKLASLFSDNVKEADSEIRKKLHLASVFVCNFTNALMGIGEELIDNTPVDKSDLLPLVNQTIKKLNMMSPKEAQTGPAVRGDSKVIESHLSMLEDKPDYQKLYSIFTDIIYKSSHQ